VLISSSGSLAGSRSEETGSAKQRMELWEALHTFISQQGGWVTSPPGTKTVRIEIQREFVIGG
jgi:hypothetical protein